MKNDHWTIIANATHTDLEWMLTYLNNTHIIVCDGAYDAIKNWGIAIDTILGDFDSTTYPMHSPRFVHIEDQNKTDLQKAIEYADKQNANSITILNGLGNAMDHTLHNMLLLKRLYQPHRPIQLLHPIHDINKTYPCSGIQYLQYFHNESILLEGEINSSLSLFGFPECIASSQGLTWELERTPLAFATLDSSRNRLANPTAVVTVQHDAILMMDAAIRIILNY